MNEQLIIQVCETVLSITIISGILLILMATWYDIRIIRLRKRAQSIYLKHTNRRWPKVTVLICAHNAATTIQSCLHSVQANTYPHYTVVVANNASTDETRKQVLTYGRQQPTMPISIYTPRGELNRETLVRRALNRTPLEQIIVTLDADTIISPSALQQCASRFMSDTDLAALRIRHSPTNTISIRTLPHYFYSLSINVLFKSFARYSSQYRRGLIHNGSAFKRSALDNQAKLTSKSVDYANDITYIQSHPPNVSLKHSLSTLSIPQSVSLLLVSILVISMISYFSYTASLLQSNTLLTLSWLATSAWLLMVVWFDDTLPTRTKFDLSVAVPFMYFYFFIYAFSASLFLLYKIFSSIPTPRLTYDRIQLAIVAELYSSRY